MNGVNIAFGWMVFVSAGVFGFIWVLSLRFCAYCWKEEGWVNRAASIVFCLLALAASILLASDAFRLWFGA